MASHLNTRFISQCGHISLHHGPMFAAKTTRAVNLATLMSEHNTVIYVNWKGDTRDTEGGEKGKFTSHNPSNTKLSDKVDTVSTDELEKVDVTAYQIVVVDECHFYPDLYKCVKRWTQKLNKHVYVFGLDGDYRQRPIGQTLDLIPIASMTEKLLAQCGLCVDELRKAGYEGCIDQCPAAFSASIVDLDAQFSVGAKDKFIAVCSKHALEIKRQRKLKLRQRPAAEVEE